MCDGGGHVSADAGSQHVGQGTQVLQSGLVLEASETDHNTFHDARVDRTQAIRQSQLHSGGEEKHR